MTRSEDLFPLLALCARAQPHPVQQEQLRWRARDLPSWDDLPILAEAHGMEPLLYTHLQAADISIPPHVEQQLRTRAVQHSHANRVRARALVEILDGLSAAGIQVLVLKGAALAHLVYPHPGLRVMRDIDLLVSREDAPRAQTTLAEMGFNAPSGDGELPVGHRHLPVAQREADGMLVSVEIHYNLYVKGPPSAELESLRPTTVQFTVEGVTAYTLGLEDNLEHVYRHMLEGAIFKPMRLIGVADLISIAERFAADIDWAHTSSCARNALALSHRLTPLSEELLRTEAIEDGNLPSEAGDEPFWDFQGWPRSSLAAQREKGCLGILRDTFWTPEWWLRMFYGLGKGPVLWWGWLVLHPLHILRWVADYFTGRSRS